jgi:hypothetical protein
VLPLNTTAGGCCKEFNDTMLATPSSKKTTHAPPYRNSINTPQISIGDEIAMSTPSILQASTFDSSSADEGDRTLTIRKSHSLDEEDDDHAENLPEILEEMEGGVSGLDRKLASDNLESVDFSQLATWKDVAAHVYFISALGIFGTVLRFYVGRFFGLDCLLKDHDMLPEEDFLTPVSSLLCITSDGKLQRGGAIFIDLPANIIGS